MTLEEDGSDSPSDEPLWPGHYHGGPPVPNPPPNQPPALPGRFHATEAGDPVAPDGEFVIHETDAKFPGYHLDYEFSRSYRSGVTYNSELGVSWDHNYNRKLFGREHGVPDCKNQIVYTDGQLNSIVFKAIGTATGDSCTAANNCVLYTPAYPSTGRLEHHLAQQNWWVLIDTKTGLQSTFDSYGFLSSVSDLTGATIQVTWEPIVDGQAGSAAERRVKSVTDTTGRIINYIYGPGSLLQCVTLGTDCQSQVPLISFQIDATTHLLMSVTKGSDAQGTRYEYHSPVAGPVNVRTADVPGFCTTTCGTKSQSCLNEDACSLFHSVCDPTYSGYAPDIPTYLAKCTGFCQAYCTQYCWNASSPPGTCGMCGAAYPYDSCQDNCWSALGTTSIYDVCVAELNGFYPYCQRGTTTDCYDACVTYETNPPVEGGNPAYVFGSVEDLSNDIVKVWNAEGMLVVQNTYGENPNYVSFDRVITQVWGDQQLSFEYHDLNLESPTSPQYSPVPSTPNPSVVTGLDQFVSINICSPCQYQPTNPHCHGSTGADWTGCGDPVTEPPGASGAMQVPSTAVVINDLYGTVRTLYLDAKGQLLREVNLSANETTDYNWFRGDRVWYNAVLRPSKVRTVTSIDTSERVWGATEFPAPGYAGAQAEISTAFLYSGYLLTSAKQWSADASSTTLSNIGFVYDSQNRLTEVDEYMVDGNPTPLRTTYAYGSGSGGSSVMPSGITEPSGAVTQFDYADPRSPNPTRTVVDATGASPLTSYATYDPVWGLPLERGLVGRGAVKSSYDHNGRLASFARRLDPNAQWFTKTYTYASGDEPTAISDPKEVSYPHYNVGDEVINVMHWPSQPNDPTLGRRWCHNYGPDGRLFETILPEGNSIVYQYDAAGRLTHVKKGFDPVPPRALWSSGCVLEHVPPTGDPGQEQILSYYYQSGGFLQGMHQGVLRIGVQTDGFGRIIEVLDGVGNRERRGYDGLDRIVWIARFSDDPNVPAYAKPTGSEPGLVAMTEIEYDRRSRPTLITRWNLNADAYVYGTRLYTAYEYRDLQNQAVETKSFYSPYSGNTTTVGVWTRSYDGAGRLVQTIEFDGSQTNIAYSNNGAHSSTATQATFGSLVVDRDYDGLGLVVSEVVGGQQVLAESHDVDGNTLSRTAVAEGTTIYAYDAFNRPTSVTLALGSDPSPTTTFSFDGNDRLVSLTDPRNDTTTSVYDGLDRLLRRTDSLSQTTTYQFYPGMNELISVTDAVRTVNSSYDDAGRLIQEDVHIVGAPNPVTRTFAYTALGKIQTATISGSGMDNTTTLTWDSLGNLIGDSNSIVPHSMWAEYDPLSDGWLKTFGIGNRLADIGYDRYGRVTSSNVGGIGFAALYDYNNGFGIGPPLSYYDTAWTNHVFTYDALGRRTGIDVITNPGSSVGRQVLASIHDSFGPDGVPRARRREFNGMSAMTDVFGIDSGGRVRGENLRIGGVDPFGSQVDPATTTDPLLQTGTSWRSYGIDALANRTTTTTASGTTNSSFDALNRMTSSGAETVQYDALDNQVTLANGARVTFDPFDHVSHVDASPGSVDYTYDALGRRIIESRNGIFTYLAWDGNKLLEHGNDVDGYRLEMYGYNDEHVLSLFADNSGLFYVNEPLGSVAAVTDGYHLLEAYSYSAFGEPTLLGPDGQTLSASAVGNRHLYNGAWFDSETATYLMGARHYEPSSGRFLSTDPIGLVGGLNLYEYTGGNPLSFGDPTGLTRDGKWRKDEDRARRRASAALNLLPRTQLPLPRATLPLNWSEAISASNTASDVEGTVLTFIKELLKKKHVHSIFMGALSVEDLERTSAALDKIAPFFVVAAGVQLKESVQKWVEDPLDSEAANEAIDKTSSMVSGTAGYFNTLLGNATPFLEKLSVAATAFSVGFWVGGKADHALGISDGLWESTHAGWQLNDINENDLGYIDSHKAYGPLGTPNFDQMMCEPSDRDPVCR